MQEAAGSGVASGPPLPILCKLANDPALRAKWGDLASESFAEGNLTRKAVRETDGLAYTQSVTGFECREVKQQRRCYDRVTAGRS